MLPATQSIEQVTVLGVLQEESVELLECSLLLDGLSRWQAVAGKAALEIVPAAAELS